MLKKISIILSIIFLLNNQNVLLYADNYTDDSKENSDINEINNNDYSNEEYEEIYEIELYEFKGDGGNNGE